MGGAFQWRAVGEEAEAYEGEEVGRGVGGVLWRKKAGVDESEEDEEVSEGEVDWEDWRSRTTESRAEERAGVGVEVGGAAVDEFGDDEVDASGVGDGVVE